MSLAFPRDRAHRSIVDHDAAVGLSALSAVFGSLGRSVVCLDEHFRVVHVSDSTLHMIVGVEISEYLGEDLFGSNGSIRLALLAGERREGWRAYLRSDDGVRLLSISAAPLIERGPCDDVRYIVVLRPAEEEATASGPIWLSGLVARSSAMQRVVRLIDNLQSSSATILLTGESGTGKEVVARAIHSHSQRRDQPFVAVNCGALPPDLLESELFGHVRGAFTGAIRDRVGRFELAGQGTLFLDEIGDLPLPLQVKLLRILQERTFERVGESRPRTTEARIIAATNVDLRAAVRAGRFREDLYYRLSVIPIEIPPLRERREDIEPLARALLARVSERQGRQLLLSRECIRIFLQHTWPGNVREMENALEYAVAVARGQTVLPEDLPPELGVPEKQADDEPKPEIERIRAALEAAHWRRDAAAISLHMSRSTLWRKMREYGLLGVSS
ncbi:MAG TPA: sigma 54-interacting transcriptional regulator [Thermoanaerobaculia bacterium]